MTSSGARSSLQAGAAALTALEAISGEIMVDIALGPAG